MVAKRRDRAGAVRGCLPDGARRLNAGPVMPPMWLIVKPLFVGTARP